MTASAARRVASVHFLNDRSGSPAVLRQALEVLRQAGYEVDLHTNRGTGCLSGLDVRYRFFSYRYFQRSKLLTMLAWGYLQGLLFWRFLWGTARGQICLFNTIQPFGAALAAALRGGRVVYYLHEGSFRPKWLEPLLFGVAHRLAWRKIYVSRDLAQCMGADRDQKQARVIPNCLGSDFLARAHAHTYRQRSDGKFVVALICSLRRFKGPQDFVQLARAASGDTLFVLHVSATRAAIDAAFAGSSLPSNLEIQSVDVDVHTTYRRASLVLNLSHPELCRESFGLTLLEAMAYAIPVIGPTVGGPSELIQDGINGFQCSVLEPKRLGELIAELANSPARCAQLSSAARQRADEYSPERYRLALLASLE